MKTATKMPLRQMQRVYKGSAPARHLHSSIARTANVAPIVGTGPPPEPPSPATVIANQLVERRRKQAQLLKQAKDIRNGKGTRGEGLKQRFWKNVTVEEVDGALQVHLDTRALRHPETKEVIRLPASKTNMATALAVEWDMLTSAQDAMKQHLIPLTSLVCRAIDIEKDDVSGTAEDERIRKTIADALLRYLDTDSLLCWAPPAKEHDLKNDAGESLRDVQKKSCIEIVGFLTTHVWPGITIRPVLDGDSLVPQSQDTGVRELIQGWIMGLDAYEIAGLERAVLAGKSLIAAARLVVEWSAGNAGAGKLNKGQVFGVEEAAVVTSLEVNWQTQQWGEVEDTHDVNHEDVRRQFGSVVLLVSGTPKDS